MQYHQKKKAKSPDDRGFVRFSVTKKLTAFLLIIVFLSCSPASDAWRRPIITGSFVLPNVANVCIDLPKQNHRGAYEAVRLWDRALRSWRRFKPIDGSLGQCDYWVHEVDKPINEGSRALAWTSSVGGREISMLKGRYENDVREILLHEMGHALGAQHLPGTLMNPTWAPYLPACPDASTVAQVAAWNHIDLDLLSWCVP